jgi:glycosyltransferase involved in cell wall biosynthesis
LGSIAVQDVTGGVEVVVVNDQGSSVAPVVRRWEDVMRVHLVDLDRHSGSAAARNVGVERAAGEYIAFLDDDDLFMPDHLATGCVPLDCGEADFVYLGALVADRRLGCEPSSHDGFRLKAYPYDRNVLMVANFLHTGSVIARNFLHTAVRFDEKLDVCEDWDLWLALTDAGYRVRFVDEITSVYHQVPESGGLVADAQLVSPSRFEVARDYIQSKWRASDPLVVAYREWMIMLENVRSDLIRRGRRMPNLLFDDVLGYLHGRMRRREPVDYSHIGRFFG